MTNCQSKPCRRKATMVIRNAFQTSANGKRVCSSSQCFTALTGGYPAEGKALA